MDKFKQKGKKSKKRRIQKDPLEELMLNKSWKKIFNSINKLRNEWNKKPLTKDEKDIIKKLFNEWKNSGKNIVLFANELKGEDRIIWEEFLATIRHYPNNEFF